MPFSQPTCRAMQFSGAENHSNTASSLKLEATQEKKRVDELTYPLPLLMRILGQVAPETLVQLLAFGSAFTWPPVTFQLNGHLPPGEHGLPITLPINRITILPEKRTPLFSAMLYVYQTNCVFTKAEDSCIAPFVRNCDHVYWEGCLQHIPLYA